jgi:hypothetical protein
MSDDILIKIERGIYLGIINLTKTLRLEKIKNQSKYLIRYILRKVCRYQKSGRKLKNHGQYNG